MRQPKYLSPSSITLFYKDRMEFYRKYLATNRQPRLPQTEPMSVGSAFDAYIKNYLAKCLGMKEAKDELDLNYLLKEQVEPQNMDFAVSAGRICFEAYKSLGATGYLMKELENAGTVPCFEYTVQATINDTVPLLGKPDLYFHTKDGQLCIYDWKVNGYCSKSNTSPNKGYIRMLTPGKPLKVHKNAVPLMSESGILLDGCTQMHDLNTSWSMQLAIYGWVIDGLDATIIAGIDQLACGKEIRVASYRNKLGNDYLADLWARCCYVWENIKSAETVFVDTEWADSSLEKCAELEKEADAYITEGDSNEEWYTSMMRKY